MKRKWFMWVGSVVGILFVLIAGVVGCAYSSGASYYDYDSQHASMDVLSHMRTWDEHDALYPNGTDSYLFDIKTDRGALLYYGAKHSRDVNHPQRKKIEQSWASFHPTIALCEGRSRAYLVGPIFEAFLGLPEPALVHKLARRDNIPLYTLEPQYEKEVDLLLGQWTPPQVAMYFTLRVYWSEADGNSNESLAMELMKKRTSIPKLQGVLTSISDIDREWKVVAPETQDWRRLTASPDYTFFKNINEASRNIRSEHMLYTLIDLVRKGERVFAVVGCSHVIRQEPVIHMALDQPASQ